MKASEVPAVAELRQRHKNNPRGRWVPLTSLAERLPQREVEAFVEYTYRLSEESLGSATGWRWERVVFPVGGNRVTDPEQQRRAGKASGKARQPKAKKEKKEKLNAKG